MNRREFLTYTSGAAVAASLSRVDPAFALDSDWRTFEVTTQVEVLKPAGATRVWLPAALLAETPFQKTLANDFKADGGKAQMIENKADALGIVAAEFPDGQRPVVTLTSRIATKNYDVDLSKPGKPGNYKNPDTEYFLRATKLMPTDGIVKTTADQITAGKNSDVEKARAIYEWVVENTFRNPKTRGCGTGDIRFMLETKDLGGKCADLNALYVGLARAAGLPARDVYGIRVAKSDLGYKSLGPATPNITKAQHCRAEVYLQAYGWVPVDPADVRKVVLEEPPGNLPLDNDMVKAARARLFGEWEMNWMAYNYAHDVELPGSQGKSIGFLMYPQAETQEGRLDPLNSDNFKYDIEVRQIS
jgi:transglutaminase-like putative cysteine protease